MISFVVESMFVTYFLVLALISTQIIGRGRWEADITDVILSSSLQFLTATRDAVVFTRVFIDSISRCHAPAVCVCVCVCVCTSSLL